MPNKYGALSAFSAQAFLSSLIHCKRMLLYALSLTHFQALAFLVFRLVNARASATTIHQFIQVCPLNALSTLLPDLLFKAKTTPFC